MRRRSGHALTLACTASNGMVAPVRIGDPEVGQNGALLALHLLGLGIVLVVAASTCAVIDSVTQIPVLAERGTVDSGALGMLIVLSALRTALAGHPTAEDPVAEVIRQHTHPLSDTTVERQDGYEVMGTMDLSALDAAELRHELDDAGDSVIVSAVSENENGYTWRVHVHVADPDTALDLMRRRGTARNVTVTSLAAEPR